MAPTIDPRPRRRVGVVQGGRSSEREVSLRTGAAVARALRARGHDVVEIDAAADLAEVLRRERVEVVFLALHGRWGEDGCVQGLLEWVGVPYTGAGVLASALTMDKLASKHVFVQAGLPTPPWRPTADAAAAADLGYPVVVKPVREGSSVGVTVVGSADDLPAALAAGHGHGALFLERYVAGRELSAAVLDGEPLGVIEIRPAAGVFDYQAKYQRPDTAYLCPAPIPDALRARVEEIAARADRALGLRGATRADLMLDADGEVWLLEVNSLPGLTERSLLPKIAAARGIPYDELCERILAGAGLDR